MVRYGMGKAMTEQPPRPKRKTVPKPPPGEPARVGGPRAIADLMPDIGRAAFRRFGFVQSSIVTRWADIVGPRYADVTAPESIRFPAGKRAGGTLNLVVAGGHATMVQHILPEIIERVNRFFGYDAVSKVAMRHGELPEPMTPVEAPPRMLRPRPIELGESLRDVGDPELRQVLEALAEGLANPPPLPKIG